MIDQLAALLERMRLLERQIRQALQAKEAAFLYQVRKGKVRFTEAALDRHRHLVKSFSRYFLDSQFLVILTTPVIWACLAPIAFLDLMMSVYQGVCFPIYGIPKVKRRDYIILDRRHLAYLNWVEKLNCVYCGYANGVLAWSVEIGARTEQYWCPIKNALRKKSMHSRYRFFLDYGDAEHYRKEVEAVRRSFEDIDADAPDEPAPPM